MLDPARVKVIIFDYDGTLRDSINPDVPGTKPHAFAQAVARYHPALKDREPEIARIYFETSGMNRVRQLRIVEERFKISNPIEAEKESEWSALFDTCTNDREWPLFPDALPALTALRKRGYSLGIGSSIPQQRLETVMSYHSELLDKFEFLLGNQKWHKGLGDEANFGKGISYTAYVCGKYGVTPEQVAYVGDTPEDMKSGFESGVYTIGRVDARIPHRREKLIAEFPPDLTIESLMELLDTFTKPV